MRTIIYLFFLLGLINSSFSQVAGTPYIAVITPNPLINSFNASSVTINSGNSTTLIPNFDQGSAIINNGVGSVSSGQGYSVSPSATTTYTLTVTNSVGKSISQSVTVFVNSISITSQPVSVTVNANTFTTLNLNASATGSITYQWYDENGPLIDYFSRTYRNNVAGRFYAIVTSTLNGISTSVTSNTAIITHNDVSITTQPSDAMFGTGGSAEINVTATGSGTLTYQWYIGSNVITGANSRTYSASTENSYHVEVTSTLNGVSKTLRSNGIYVSENKVTITSLGENFYATSGFTTSLSPTYSYNPAAILSFQWYNTSGAINGQTNPTLTTGTAGNYYIVITSQLNNTTGVATSTTATVTVVNTPSITSLTPDNYGISLGSSTNLTPIFANGTGIITPGNIPVTSGNSITISPTVTTAYTLTVTNQAGTSYTFTTNVVITKGVFSSTASTTISREFNFSFLLNNGKVLVANSGWSGNATTELYDYQTGTFRTTGLLNWGNRYLAAAVALSGNQKVLFTGGAYLGAQSEIYDQTTETFTNISNMTISRHGHSATLLNDGKVFISGGKNSSFTYLSNTEIYDPVSNTFSAARSMSMSSARFRHGSITLNNGTVLIAGGQTNNSTFLKTAVIYDPVANTYTSTENDLSEAKSIMRMVKLNNGKVLVLGGANHRMGGEQPTNTADIYDPTTKRFTQLPNLPDWMYHFTATLQNDGMVLITGGQNSMGSAELQAALLFDPSTNQFIRNVTPMLTPRAWHSATLLPNGKTLIIGGYSSNSKNSAEIYDPN
jgi:hypothetical protein